MHIVLHQPEIPHNTGAIGRTCVATGTPLHLIEPLGFSLSEKAIKRAGMDYWDKLELTRHMNFEAFWETFEAFHKTHPGAKLWMATTKAKQVYSEVSFGPDDFLMFGRESAGIPEEILVEHEESCIRIPMLSEIRSLNLANSVSIVLYEALRQNHFGGMQTMGELHRLHWHDKPEAAFIAPNAVVQGEVSIGKDVGIWYHATVRADRAPITIGEGTNVQDNAVLHVGIGFPLSLGRNVTIGHGAIVHGCTVGDGSLIGMGAIVMNGSRIGRNCIIGAGTVVTQGVEVPDNSLVLGNPGRIKRAVTEEEIAQNLENARFYVEEAYLERHR